MEKFLNKWEILITIIISITSIFLAIKANEMTKIQTEVARNSSLPNIQVVEKNLINEKTGKTDDSIIQISNLNGRLNNYESRIVTFLKCSYLDNKNNVYEEEIPQYKALKNVFLNESEDNTKYAEILKELRAHIMVSNMYVDKRKRERIQGKI